MVEIFEKAKGFKSLRQFNESKKQIHGCLGFANLNFGDESGSEILQEHYKIENDIFVDRAQHTDQAKGERLNLGSDKPTQPWAKMQAIEQQNFEGLDLESIKRGLDGNQSESLSLQEEDYVASRSQMDERSEDFLHEGFESKFANQNDKSVESSEPDGTAQAVRSLVCVYPATNQEQAQLSLRPGKKSTSFSTTHYINNSTVFIGQGKRDALYQKWMAEKALLSKQLDCLEDQNNKEGQTL